MSAVPRLSIGLPVYNGEEYVAESLDALLGQTYGDFELIISDNASTDGTADICRRYEKKDSRIRYIRQPRNIGANPNHNFVFQQSHGELFKWASADDVYAPTLLQCCIDALDEHRDVVLAHSWTAAIDGAGKLTQALEYPLATDSLRAPKRFRSILLGCSGLFDSGDGDDRKVIQTDNVGVIRADDQYGVIRANVLRRVAPAASYYHADRIIVLEIALHGLFHQTPEWLYFRRDHPGRAAHAPTARTFCAALDPRRSDRLRHPVARLYAEYMWGFAAAIQRAPLSHADRRECYHYLAQWVANRAANRVLPRRSGRTGDQHSADDRAGLRPDCRVCPREEGLVTIRGFGGSRKQSADALRVGLFGLLGTGNIGNDASMDAVLRYLRTDHPDAVLDAMCPGPERLKDEYGVQAVSLYWHHKYERRASGVTAIALKALGKGVDAFRTASWVRQHDVVIVPGMGVLEASLPLRPWETPYAMFLLCVSGRLFGTKVALVSVGANVINQRTTRWLFNSAARLAFYRSYRDESSRDAMRQRGVDITRDRVYPDLVFAIPVPPCDVGDPQTVGIGVMDYNGTNDDRQRAEEIHAAYVENLKGFARWLVDSGRRIRLFIGDTCDVSVVDEIAADLRIYRPDLDSAWVIAERVTSFAELMRAMAPVSAVVATRYHNVVCALKLGKPVISLGYAAKNLAVLADAGLSDFSQSANSPDADQLIRQFKELESRSAELRQTMTERNAENARLLNQQFAELSAALFPTSEAACAATEHVTARTDAR
jgi:polysaccharide pyruvyl transferase WcaK-like protein/glycosyltransferase involved in cell wall biosynthesis